MAQDFAFNFKRIAYSADGNADPDDIGATPAGLAMLAHVGLQNNLVHYHVNSQVWKKPNAKEEKMRDSAFGSATRMGFNQNSFFDVAQEYRNQGENNSATRHLANQINASSADDPLYIVAAGPMEAIYQAVTLASANKRSFVKVVSHSSINDNNVGDGRGRTRSDLESLGVSFVDISDQNGGFSTHKDFGPWTWMKDSSNPDLQWTYDRMRSAGKADISDAGMIFYALTGDQKGDISKLRKFFDSQETPNPDIPNLPDTGNSSPAQEALLVVDAGKSLGVSSTFASGSFQLTNNSSNGQKISRILIDSSTSVFPDLVFDPNGGAGDSKGKKFTVDQSSDVGLLSHAFRNSRDGGFDVLEIKFDDFSKGEKFTFSLDMDPTSTKGTASPGPNHAGSVSGLELTGATVTVEFSDGKRLTNQLYKAPNSQTASQVKLKSNLLPRPSLEILGISSKNAVVSKANQTVRVRGPKNASVAFLQIEGAFYTEDGTGFDMDPFEANTALTLNEKVVKVGDQGFVDIPVTLAKTDSDGGLNHLVAVFKGSNGATSAVSEPIILTLNANGTSPSAPSNPPLQPSPPSPPVAVPDLGSVIKGTSKDDNLFGNDQGQTLRGRKGDDRITAGGGDDKVFGNKGDDILVGVQVKASLPGQGEQDILGGGKGVDTFVLGDNSKVYYDDGKANTTGIADYAFIRDFNSQEGDKIQLKGKSSDYVLGASPENSAKETAIFLKTSGQNELVGIIDQKGGNQQLSLNSNVFTFV